MSNLNMVYSDNPYMDVLVYNTKQLAYGAVVKNQEEADKYETAESIRESDRYIACMEGRAYFELFVPYPAWVITSSTIPPGENNVIWKRYIEDNYAIPPEYREELMNKMINYYLNDYDEPNEYYKRLAGMPPVNDPSTFIYVPEDWIDDDTYITDISKPIHKMTNYDIEVLEAYGILDKLKEQHPEALYLNFLGYRRISIYRARKAVAFELLYLPSCDSEEIRRQYIEAYHKNVEYTRRVIYSDAFKYESDYYDNFISLLITIQTMVDVITNIQINILKKEIFDSRTLRYLFESYGIPYYSEIPMKYQVAMIKNIHTLLKYKSTNRNIVDICSLFGYDNINIFKYYLLKDRAVISAPDDPIIKYDNAAFSLKFIKVPLTESVDDYVRDPTNYIDYEDVVSQDEFWAKDKSNAEIKKAIMEKEFSLVRTKYLSVDSICDLAQIGFNIAYFFNFIFDNVKLEETLTVYVPSLEQGKAFRMTDLFVFLTAINFQHMGVEDTIFDSTEQVLYVKGFNFKADLAALAQYIADNHLTEELIEASGVYNLTKMNLPKSNILTYKQMLQIFTDNSKVYNHIITQMAKAESKRIYDIYKKLYDSLMIIEYNHEYFTLPDGTMAKTYTEYLKYRDPVLYKRLQAIFAIPERNTQIEVIVRTIDSIISAFEEYLSLDLIKYIFRYFPSYGEELIQGYILKMVNFFKSYKTQMLNIGIVYVIDDRLDCNMRAIDWIKDLISVYDIKDTVNILEDIDLYIASDINDRYKIMDKILIEVSRLISKSYNDKYNITDDIKLSRTKYLEEAYKILNALIMFRTGEYREYLSPDDKFDETIAHFTFKENGSPSDKISIESFNS